LKGTHPGTIPAIFGLIWFCGFRGEDLNVIFYQNMPNFQIKPSLAWMVPGWVPFKIVSDSPSLHSRWLLLLKIEISSIVHCCFSLSQNKLSHLEWRAELSDTILKWDPPKDYPSQIWFNLVLRFQRRRFKELKF
jgi:hypothetical protein